MRTLLTATVALALTLAPGWSMRAQVLPDRIVTLDPLADHSLDSAGFTWLNGSRLYAEFGRYASGDGDHRWSARMGGVMEVLRWDSTANVTFIGTMEIVVDPNNDIAFNPRAIFWEEGIVAGFALGRDAALQAGYVHRCKHDIDNLEILASRRTEQRTLIYSGLMTRLLLRPTELRRFGDWSLDAGISLRNDFFLHLLDDRLDAETRPLGRDLESLVDALTLTERVDIGRSSSPWGAHMQIAVMLSLFGARPGFSERFGDIDAELSVPFVELGVDLRNPTGSTLTLFIRREQQRDAGISSTPTSASLVLVGVRLGDARGVW